MGDIQKTAAGTYRVRWYDANGRRQTKTLKTKTQATTYLKKAEGDRANGIVTDPKRGRVSLSKWIEECREADFALEPGTIDTEARAAKRVNDMLGDTLLCNLTPTDIERYISKRLEAGAAPGYVAMEFRILRKWLNRAVARDKILKSPCAYVKAPTGDPAEMRFLTLSQLVGLAESIQPRYRAWVYTLGIAGLRFSEANGLRRQSVKLLQSRLDITEQMVWDRQKRDWHRKTRLKTKASRRTVTIASPLTEILADHLGRYSGVGPEGLVFPNKLGRPISPSSFRKSAFTPALEAAGIDPAFRIHDLRHTAVALAIAEGAHPTAIQRRMGHSSIAVTLGIYGHLFPEIDEELSGRLGVSFAEALNGQKVVQIRSAS